MKPLIFFAQFSDHFRLMRGRVVPDDDDESAKVTQQISKEIANLNLGDVVFIESVIESQVFLYRAD